MKSALCISRGACRNTTDLLSELRSECPAGRGQLVDCVEGERGAQHGREDGFVRQLGREVDDADFMKTSDSVDDGGIECSERIEGTGMG